MTPGWVPRVYAAAASAPGSGGPSGSFAYGGGWFRRLGRVQRRVQPAVFGSGDRGYECVDRIVLNAFFPPRAPHWRVAHLVAAAARRQRRRAGQHAPDADGGRFARRVKAWGAANGLPVIFCTAGERKHRITEEYLASHEVGVGVFVVLVAKALAPVWKVAHSSKTAAIVNIER